MHVLWRFSDVGFVPRHVVDRPVLCQGMASLGVCEECQEGLFRYTPPGVGVAFGWCGMSDSGTARDVVSSVVDGPLAARDGVRLDLCRASRRLASETPARRLLFCLEIVRLESLCDPAFYGPISSFRRGILPLSDTFQPPPPANSSVSPCSSVLC